MKIKYGKWKRERENTKEVQKEYKKSRQNAKEKKQKEFANELK